MWVNRHFCCHLVATPARNGVVFEGIGQALTIARFELHNWSSDARRGTSNVSWGVWIPEQFFQCPLVQ